MTLLFKITPARVALLFALATAFVMTVMVSDHLSTRYAVGQEARRAKQSATLLASGFQRELEKFRLASLVLAQDPDVSAVTSRDAGRVINALNEKLELLTRETKASAIYVLDEQGTTLSSSNWQSEDSFVGENYGFRAYFNEAFTAGSFEQFALGTLSGEPGLYIARRINGADGFSGVVVIKVIFDELEAEWAKTDYITFATNQTGIILVTSRPEWRFQTTKELTKSERTQIRQRLEYGDRALQMNSYFAEEKVALAKSPDAASHPYIEAIEPLALDWSVHALTPIDGTVQRAVNRSRSVLVITFIVLGCLFAIFVQFRRNARLKADADLEMQTKQMNDRLAQANKLATLGQVAAGVGHEINQPLAAIGSFSANAAKFLAMDQIDPARENLTQISSLVERIGNITRELRGFAKKATGKLEPVSVVSAIDGALLLLRDRISSTQSTIILDNKNNAKLVMAEKNRLEQVLVNLFQNALDAGGSKTQIKISFAVDGEYQEVKVSDNGPGLSDHAKEGLFQPFTSSKKDGLGLGLVISRDIMIDLGGDLQYLDEDSGATFLLRLEIATS